MKRIRSSIFIILAFVFSLTFVKDSFAGEWITNDGYKYYYENGAFVVNDWKDINKITYYFDEQGRMATSLMRIGKKYYLFHANGVPYNKDEKVILNGHEYEIGPRGRVNDLELNIDDTTYIKILADLKSKKAEEEAFLATSYASPDVAPAVSFVAPEEKDISQMSEEELRLAEIAEANKAIQKQFEAEALALKYKALSLEFRNELLKTAKTAGIDPTTTADALMNVFQNQLLAIKQQHFSMILSILQNNPEALNLDLFYEEYKKTIEEYESEIDIACKAIRERYSMLNTPFVLMKDKFTVILDGENRAFRQQIMDLLR